MSFQLDTSGRVQMPEPFERHGRGYWEWTDLDAFTQGYVEAMLSDTYREMPISEEQWRAHGGGPFAFRHLAPETLARIMGECELFVRLNRCRENGHAGVHFWQDRQDGAVPGFPPLTPYLSDDGKVMLREGL